MKASPHSASRAPHAGVAFSSTRKGALSGAAAKRVLSRLLRPEAIKGNYSPSPTQLKQKEFAANGFVSPSPIRKMTPLSPLSSASPLRARSAALARDGGRG